MRLRVMQNILTENLEELKVEIANVNSQYEIKDFQNLSRALREVTEFKFLSKEKARLEGITVYHSKNERTVVDNSTLNEFRGIIDSMILKINTVITAIEEAIPEQDQKSISIKLPDFADLVKISNFIKEINTILNQSLVGKYKGTIKLQNFDTGTNWIEIVLSNQDAIVFFGQIVNVATNLLKVEYLKWKETEQNIRALVIENDAKEIVLEGLKNEFKAKAELNAKMLAESAEITENQIEYQAHLTKNIMNLTEFLSIGVEVHTALNAPEPVQEAFPNVEETKQIVEHTIKLLTNSEEDSNENI